MTKQQTHRDHWTQIMDHCYARNCTCAGCHYLTYTESQRRCYVKKAIIEYIKKYGVAPGVITKGIIE